METEKWPIVQTFATYEDYGFKGVHPEVDRLFREAVAAAPSYVARGYPALVRYLQCYLFLIGEALTLQRLREPKFKDLALGFVGALNSSRFIQASIHIRTRYTRNFLRVLRHVGVEDAELEGIGSTCSDRDAQLACRFEQLSFSEEKLWLLRGWWTENKNGLRAHLPLHPLVVRFGRQFAQCFFEACDGYFRARASAQICGLRELVKFMASHDHMDLMNLEDTRFMSGFWRDFIIFYTKTRYATGISADAIISTWLNHVVPFAEDALEASGLFAQPLGGYPSPRAPAHSGARSRVIVREDGIEVKTRLLTHVPLHITDVQAVEILFFRIRRDVDLVRTWARAEVAKTNARVERRKLLSTVGTVRKIQPLGSNTPGQKFLSSPENPDALANAAATLKELGYVTAGDLDVKLLFPQPLRDTAFELGIPITGTLTPYLAILVLEHPCITTAFLEKLRLFSDSGDLVGLVPTDGKHYLIGDKSRNGEEKAEQRVPLSIEALQAIQALIELTAPIRDYLRDRNDPDWQFLLLTSGKAFGVPHRIRKYSPLTSLREMVEAIARSMTLHADIPDEEARCLARRFSLGNLRASVGTLVYLETQSVHKMAEAMGHATYDSDLLSRYLPLSLQEFFQERWIRTFQNGILAEAMKDSRHLLQSTDFASEEELDAFLRQHALKTLPPTVTSKEAGITDKTKEVVFGLDVGILTILLSIEDAVTNSTEELRPSKVASRWASLSRALVAYIESEDCAREDLREQLNLAKSSKRSSDVEPFVYA